MHIRDTKRYREQKASNSESAKCAHNHQCSVAKKRVPVAAENVNDTTCCLWDVGHGSEQLIRIVLSPHQQRPE